MTRLYVGNIPWSTSVDELRDIFSPCGQISFLSIPTGRQNRSRGYGIVEFVHEQEALNAVANLNGTQLGDRAITVREDKVGPRGGPSGGGGGGGGGGDVNLDNALSAVMQAWSEEYAESNARVREIFAEADDNGDMELTYDEYATVVRKIKPDVPTRKLKSVFREALAISGVGNCISEGAFSLVAEKLNLAGDIAGQKPLHPLSAEGAIHNEYSLLRNSWSFFGPELEALLTKLLDNTGGDKNTMVELEDIRTQMTGFVQCLDSNNLSSLNAAWMLYRRIVLALDLTRQKEEITSREKAFQEHGAAAFKSKMT